MIEVGDRGTSVLETALLQLQWHSLMDQLGPVTDLDGFPTDSTALAVLEHLDDQEDLCATDAVRAMVLAQRLAARLEQLTSKFAAIIGDNPDPDDWAREEVSAALNVSLFQSDRYLRMGRAFEGEFVATGEAVRDGEISFPHAVALVEGLSGLTGDVDLPSLEEQLLDRAADERVGAFRATVKRMVAEAEPKTFDERCAMAQECRRVWVYPDEYAMGHVSADLPGPVAMAFDKYLDGCADAADRYDPRTRDQLRADAFAAMISEALAKGGLPTHQGLPVQLNVTMTQASVFGQTQTPAELDGYGPIPASMGRELAADADWRAFIIDASTAHLRALGTLSYRPSQELREFLVYRSGVCDFVTCGRDATRCDLDHAIPWPEGPTDETNVGPHCRRHHRCKHGPWTFERNDDGSGTWTSPLGFRYPSYPRTFPLDD